MLQKETGVLFQHNAKHAPKWFLQQRVLLAHYTTTLTYPPVHPTPGRQVWHRSLLLLQSSSIIIRRAVTDDNDTTLVCAEADTKQKQGTRQSTTFQISDQTNPAIVAVPGVRPRPAQLQSSSTLLWLRVQGLIQACESVDQLAQRCRHRCLTLLHVHPGRAWSMQRRSCHRQHQHHPPRSQNVALR